MARKFYRRRTLQFFCACQPHQVSLASPKGLRLTEWSREYRAREIAEKSDPEVLLILKAF